MNTEEFREEDRQCLFWLTRIPGVGAVTADRIWNSMKQKHCLYNIEEKELIKEKLISQALAEAFRRAKEGTRRDEIRQEYESLKQRNIRFLTPYDQEYPESLRKIEGKPMGIYVKGSLPDPKKPVAAIIGARECSSYGKQLARFLGKELSQWGIQIVSGLAAGIDGAGNRGALDAGSATYGVLGCGINICYPTENYPLYEEMERRGGIISEYGLGEPPRAGNFPVRNRIISGLADVVIIIEAREKSGSLITAEIALEQGKDIFAVPGRITDTMSAGCNQLIQGGAFPLLQADDILDYFGIQHKKQLRIREKSEKGLAKKEKKVYSCLDLQPKFIEEIVKESGLPVHECMGILLDLELKNYIVQEGGHYYRKNCE